MRLRLVSLFLAVFVLLFAQVENAFAAEEGIFYYLLPPSSAIFINDKKVSSFESKGKMVFQKDEKEILTVPKNVFGVKMRKEQYAAQVKNESVFMLSSEDGLSLLSGSLHIATFSTSDSATSLHMGDLKLDFRNADFLVFVSGEGEEKLVKVLDGEVSLEHRQLRQTVTLKSGQSTSTDTLGRLLIPFSFEPKNIQRWWERKEYEYPFDQLPVAHAGDDQRVLGNIPVVLDGSQSEFETGDVFEWALIKGPRNEKNQEIKEVSFDSTNIVKPLFTPNIEGEYRFRLQITNAKAEKSNADEVQVFVGKKYLKPIAIFDDVSTTHVNTMAITYFYKKNVMKGEQDEKAKKLLFRPDDLVNRVEILKILFDNKRQKTPSLEELKALKEGIFLDVKASHWFAPYVYLAKKMNLVKGSKGLYRPADPVLFIEALKIIADINAIPVESYVKRDELPFKDSEDNAWYLPYLFFVKKYNLVDPDLEGNINASKPLTRAALAELLYRLESINLTEKRGVLQGKVKQGKTGKGIQNAEILIYEATLGQERKMDKESGFLEKGDLYYKTSAKNDGTFSISLPVGTKYYVEAISGSNVSSSRVIVSVEEEKPVKIELEILLSS